MKKHFTKLVCVTALATSMAAVAAGNGSTSPAGVKIGMGFDQGFGVTAQFANKFNVFIGNDGVSADYILKEGDFGADVPFNWYVGVGGVIDWDNHYSHWHSDGSWHGEDYNNYAVRVPLGVSLPFAKTWDFYAHVAPALEYRNKPHSDDDFRFDLDFALGLRYGF